MSSDTAITAGFATPSSAETFSLEQLVRFVREGRVRVPHFQRDFRWEQRDVRRLFDSIVRAYPIGSLLLWRRPADAAALRVGALRIAAPPFRDALWVVDGQQRLTSLANALDTVGSKDPKFGLAYDLVTHEFIESRQADPHTSLPLPVLFDLRELLRWFNEHPEMMDQVSEANDIAARLRTYTVPAYVVESDDLSVLQDIFDRMNNFGKRLSRAEIFSALYAPDEGLVGQVPTISRIAEECDVDTGFGRIDDDTVLRVVLARRGADVTREIRIEFDGSRRTRAEFPGEDETEGLANGQEGLLRCVRFLQAEAGVPHFTFLPYRYLLVVLARYFGHFPEPHPTNLRLLRRWFWRAATAGPEIFKGSHTGAMRQLCSRVRPGEESRSVQQLLEAVATAGTERPLPEFARFRTNTAATRIILCGMWDHGPRSLVTEEVLSLQALAQALQARTTANDICHEIAPRRALPDGRQTWAANRILLPGDDEPTTDLTTALWAAPDQVLASHFLDGRARPELENGQWETLLTRRDETLTASIRTWLVSRCEWDFEDTPPLDLFDLDDISDDGGEPSRG